MREDELVIHISKTGEISVEDTENGVTAYKKVSPETFVDCIKQSIEKNMISSGMLPPRCISYAEGSGGKRRICAELGLERCGITYENTHYPDFPLPRLVFGFNITDTRIIGVDLGVADIGMLTPKSKMYVYPFSNVSGFRLCCGANRLPEIKSPHQLSGVMRFIMSMPDNNDHYRPENTKLNTEHRTLLELLKDKDYRYYYSDVLIENGKTLQDFINHY